MRTGLWLRNEQGEGTKKESGLAAAIFPRNIAEIFGYVLRGGPLRANVEDPDWKDVTYEGWSAAAFNFRDQYGPQIGAINLGGHSSQYGLVNVGDARQWGLVNLLGEGQRGMINIGSSSHENDYGVVNIHAERHSGWSVGGIVFDGKVSGDIYSVGLVTTRSGVTHRDYGDVRLGLFHIVEKEEPQNRNQETVCLGLVTFVVEEGESRFVGKYFSFVPGLYHERFKSERQRERDEIKDARRELIGRCLNNINPISLALNVTYNTLWNVANGVRGLLKIIDPRKKEV